MSPAIANTTVSRSTAGLPLTASAGALAASAAASATATIDLLPAAIMRFLRWCGGALAAPAAGVLYGPRRARQLARRRRSRGEAYRRGPLRDRLAADGGDELAA